MNLVKTIDTSEMNQVIFDILLNSGGFVRNGVGVYHVGGFVQEYEDAWEEDKKGYSLKSLEESKKLDEYLISQGAEHLEQIFIYHGTYKFYKF
jgi:hypothetical protein